MDSVLKASNGELEPFEFSDENLLEIGRLVRNFSELEDALTYFIQQLSGTHEGAAQLMLGKSPYASRLRIAQEFVRDTAHVGAESVMAHFDNKYVTHARKMRNAVAHGTFLGRIPDGGYLACLTDREDKDPLQFGVLFCFPEKDIALAASNVRNALNQLETLMHLQEWREKRRSRPRSPRLTRQAMTGKTAERKSPPRSSQE